MKTRAKLSFTLVLCILATVGLGCTRDPGSTIGPPTGKTGNEWTEADFAHLDSKLAKQGGPEFVSYCKEVGSYKLEGEVLEKFKELLAKYPVGEQEEYDYFGVVVREGLIDAGMLPKGDPERYQYAVSALSTALATQ